MCISPVLSSADGHASGRTGQSQRFKCLRLRCGPRLGWPKNTRTESAANRSSLTAFEAWLMSHFHDARFLFPFGLLCLITERLKFPKAEGDSRCTLERNQPPPACSVGSTFEFSLQMR